MVKGSKVGRPGFSEVFSAVNSFHTPVDYSLAKVLGEVHDEDENHDGQLIHRVDRQLPTGISVVKLCFIRPLNRAMSLTKILYLAMDYGLVPAIHHETVAALRAAAPEQIQSLFHQVDGEVSYRKLPQTSSVSVVCFGSAVTGETGELIPVHEVRRHIGWSGVQLRKLNLDAPPRPAMVLPFVSV